MKKLRNISIDTGGKVGMKISCTKTEKIKIIDALMNNQFCLHPDDNESCIYDDGCWDCIEASIEWIIEEDGQ